MVAELQTTDTATIDWQSAGSTEVPSLPSPNLRLLARVPRMGDRSQSSQSQPSQSQPSRQTPPGRRTDGEQAGGLAEAKTHERESPRGGVQSLVADRAAPFGPPFGPPAGTRSRAGLASQLCEFHAAIKPYAGMIVTLALLASTGLLYWLLTGSASNPSEPQQQIGQDMLGQHSNSSEPNASLSVAPVWSDPGLRPVVKEDSASQLHASRRDPAHGTAEAIACSATPEISPAPAMASTAEVAAARVPRVKYVPIVSVPAAGPPVVVGMDPEGGLQTTDARLAETSGRPSSVGTTGVRGGPVAVTHADAPTPGSPAPQPSDPPSIQPYPKTHYGPFDFARDDASEKEGSQLPMVTRKPETSRTGQLSR